MVKVESIILSVDNGPIELGKCVKILGGSKRRYGKVGDRIILSSYRKNN